MINVVDCRFLGPAPHAAAGVANALLAALPEGWSAREPGRIHDLVWLVDGWSLVIDERRLVAEDPRDLVLGDAGPRYVTIEAALGNGRLRGGRIVEGLFARPARARLTPDEAKLVHRVARRYGAMDRRALAATHLRPGTPFAEALMGDGRYDEGAVRRHFRALAMAGRERAAA